MLFKYIKRHQKDWDAHLDFIVMAYNATPHESTGLTPHRLVYGREMTFPLDMITDPIGIEKDERKLTSEYVRILENNLKEGHEIARKNLNAAAKRQKMTYDVKVRPVTYKVGDLVWRNQKRNAPGLKSKIVRHGSSWKS
jgi:low affinity Fe/Cu permease